MHYDTENITVSKEFFNEVFSSISESIIITNLDLYMRNVNFATMDILGYEESELIDKHISMIFEEYETILNSSSLQALIKEFHVIKNVNVKYKSKIQEEIPVKFTASITRDCYHRKDITDCPKYLNNQSSCSLCKSINIIIVGRDMRTINALIQKEKECSFELASVQEISRKLNYTMNYDEFIRLIMKLLNNSINFDIAGFVLCRNSSDFVYIKYTSKPEKQLLDWYKEYLLKTLVTISENNHKDCKKEVICINIGEMNNEDQTLRIDQNDNYVCKKEDREKENDKIKTSYNSHLIVNEKIVGFINVSSFKEKTLKPNHIRMLYTIANQVTISIQHLITLTEFEKEKLASILRDMIEGVIIVNSNGFIEMLNPSGEKLLNLLSDCKKGEHLVRIGDYNLNKPMELILNEKKEFITHKLSFRNDTSHIKVSMIMTPIKDKSKITGLVIVLRDETKEYNLQQQLLHAEKLSTIGEMVSGIAHEINNPLAGIMGLTQLLQIQSELPDIVRKNVDKIFSYTDRSKRIIQNLLTFARAHKPEKTPVNINQLIEQTIEMHEYNMKTNNIKIVKNMDLGLPEVVADMYQLQQVFFNIINNAYQALIEENKEKCFTVSTKESNNKVVVSFHNTGRGIPNNIIKKIFNPFFTTKEIGKGTGMGLSVSYGIIKEHGGNIYATSKDGKGVTFLVELPIKSVGLDSISPTNIFDEADTSVQSMNILVVDDEKPVAESISSLLRLDGHTAQIVTNVNDAIEKISHNDFSMILSDIKMPGLDGKEFYMYLKLHKPYLIDCFVTMTGDVMNPKTKLFVEENGIPCIAKPFTHNELKQIISEVARNLH